MYSTPKPKHNFRKVLDSFHMENKSRKVNYSTVGKSKVVLKIE